MKKVSVLIMLLLSTALVLNSCSNNDEKVGSSSPVANDGTVQVDFDGQTFVSTAAQAIVTDSYISITGLRAPSGDIMQITIPAIEVGTYSWKTFNDIDRVFGMVYTPGGASNSFICVSEEDVDPSLDYTDTGSLTISSIDNTTKKISGTFQFTGVDFTGNDGKGKIKVFTKGVFTNIPFTSNVIQDPTETPNTFSAKLDGAAYVPTSILAILQNDKIAISAMKGSVETIGMFLPSNVEPGTYVVEDMGADFTFSYIKGMTGDSVFSGAGSVTITSHDKSKKIITGTFSSKYTSMLVDEEHNVTEGAFSVSY